MELSRRFGSLKFWKVKSVVIYVMRQDGQFIKADILTAHMSQLKGMLNALSLIYVMRQDGQFIKADILTAHMSQLKGMLDALSYFSHGIEEPCQSSAPQYKRYYKI